MMGVLIRMAKNETAEDQDEESPSPKPKRGERKPTGTTFGRKGKEKRG
jgi:hypothetical protein